MKVQSLQQFVRLDCIKPRRVERDEVTHHVVNSGPCYHKTQDNVDFY